MGSQAGRPQKVWSPGAGSEWDVGRKGGLREVAKQVALLPAPRGGTEGLQRRLGRGLDPGGGPHGFQRSLKVPGGPLGGW